MYDKVAFYIFLASPDCLCYTEKRSYEFFQMKKKCI